MAFKDFMKNASEKASTAASAAQAKHEEIKKNNAIKKEEQERKLAEMKEKICMYQGTILDDVVSNFTGIPCIEINADTEKFTKEFFEKLLLPANSVSSSRITLFPNHAKIIKDAKKRIEEFDNNEVPLMQFKGKKNDMLILTATSCYVVFTHSDNDTDYECNIKIDVDKISSLEFTTDGDICKCICNGVELFSKEKVYDFDIITINEYIRRLAEKDYEISDSQIDAIIREKIGAKVLAVVNEYIFDDELLIYFAWGADSITAKDFVVCTNKQIIMLDRELIGATKNVKQFYYEDITSMATDQKTNGALDLALTAMLKLCNITIYVSGAQETINTLFTHEAERVVKVYQECRRSIKTEQKTASQVVIQQQPVEDDVFAKLEKLNKLKDAGILTEVEFNEKKQALLELM